MSKTQKYETGDKLIAIYWPNGDEVRIDQNGCVALWVLMENGQMAAVPWAVAEYVSGPILKHNLAEVSSVEMEKTTYDTKGT